MAKDFYRVLYDEVKTEFDMKYPHLHNEFQIYYLYSGQRNVFCEGRLYTVYQGSLLYLDANKIHRVFSLGPTDYRRVLLCVDKEYIRESVPQASRVFSGMGIIRLTAEKRQLIEGLFKKLIDEIKNPDELSPLYKELIVKEIVVLVSRLSETGHDAFIKNAVMDEVLRYIDDNLDKRLTLSETAKRFNYSVSHFSRLFRESTGFTFVEYVNESRVRRAQTLLKSTKLPISEILRLTGFGSQAYFGKIFLKAAGMSPLKYRKAHKVS